MGELEVAVIGGQVSRMSDPAEAARLYRKLRREGVRVQLSWRMRPSEGRSGATQVRRENIGHPKVCNDSPPKAAA